MTPAKTATDIGFIGLGRMGAAIAARLEASDILLHVHDPVASAVAPFVARGARAHPSARSVADTAAIVFACLPSPEASLTTARAIAHGSMLTTYVETSTIGRTAMQAVTVMLDATGITTVDAPVSGGPGAARDGRLAMICAGQPAACVALTPLLERIAGSLFIVGDRPGMAQTMKLVNNMIAAATIAVTAEALASGVAAGLDPATMVAVIEASSGRSNVTTRLLPDHVLNRRFDFGATIATMVKDVELGLDEAEAFAAPMPVITAAARAWRAEAARIGNDRDLTTVFHALASPMSVQS